MAFPDEVAYHDRYLFDISSETRFSRSQMKSKSFVSQTSMPKFELWDKLAEKRVPLSFDLEITARCNNACRHCYINLPAGAMEARQKELSLEEISDIASQAVSL